MVFIYFHIILIYYAHIYVIIFRYIIFLFDFLLFYVLVITFENMILIEFLFLFFEFFLIEFANCGFSWLVWLSSHGILILPLALYRIFLSAVVRILLILKFSMTQLSTNLLYAESLQLQQYLNALSICLFTNARSKFF